MSVLGTLRHLLGDLQLTPGYGTNSSANGVQTVLPGEYIEFTAPSEPIGTNRMYIGLSYQDGGFAYTTINYCWYIYHDGRQFAVENGTTMYANSTPYVPGTSKWRITRTGGNIVYYKNGVAVRTVADANPTQPMTIDITMWDTGSGNPSKVHDLVVGKLEFVIATYAIGDYVPYTHSDYRYGYNGMEKDPELKGDGNSYTTEFRQYDPRLGRWMSLDPLMVDYPQQSPYCAFDNNPVVFTDPMGLAAGPGDPPRTKDASGNTRGGAFCSECGDEVTVNGNKSLSSRSYQKWLERQGGSEFFREVRQEIYESKKLAWNNNNMGRLVYGTNAAGNPDFTDEALNKMWSQAETEAIYAIHGLYAQEKSGIDPNGLAYMFVPGVSEAYESWLLKAASTQAERNAIISGMVVDVIIDVLPLAGSALRGVKALKSLKATRMLRLERRMLRAAACFVAGTTIQTANGEKPIEQIIVGDSVWAFDENTGNKSLKIVYNTVVRQSDHLQRLVIGNDTIMTTDDHPFFANGGWVKAEALTIGDSLYLLDGRKIALSEKRRIDTLVTVYNFAVNDYATYYIGGQGILVHNNNPCAEGFKTANSWVVRKVFLSLDPAIRKKVAAAMKKGIVAPTGKQGIIRLTATEAAETGYTYKIKILGKGGDTRIYGNMNEKGIIVFDKVTGH